MHSQGVQLLSFWGRWSGEVFGFFVFLLLVPNVFPSCSHRIPNKFSKGSLSCSPSCSHSTSNLPPIWCAQSLNLIMGFHSSTSLLCFFHVHIIVKCCYFSPMSNMVVFSCVYKFYDTLFVKHFQLCNFFAFNMRIT